MPLADIHKLNIQWNGSITSDLYHYNYTRAYDGDDDIVMEIMENFILACSMQSRFEEGKYFAEKQLDWSCEKMRIHIMIIQRKLCLISPEFVLQQENLMMHVNFVMHCMLFAIKYMIQMIYDCLHFEKFLSRFV